jgi:spore maturation protein CgeB
MKILAVGPLWRGSNAGGLFRALSRQGCLLEVVDEFYYVSLQTKNTSTKILERIIRPLQAKEFNNAIKQKISVFKPEVVLVYKGVFVQPDTLLFARQQNCKLVLFYPDVSMTNHGPNIPKCIPLYDLVFTTKTFGITDMRNMFGVKNAYFIEHGFDPEIHRKISLPDKEKRDFSCDVSFIGTFSLKKEAWLAAIKEQLPGVNLKIWGAQWNKATNPAIKDAIQHTAVLGDLYAIAIQSSLINLGILSEKVVGSSSGDLITSRTFHIPGSGGFLLHERNEESVLYFKEDEEAGFFDGPDELVKKIRYYLDNPALRETIKEAGFQRALRDHALDVRAKTVIDHINELFA